MSFTGIYFRTPAYDISGYGNVSRNFILALEKVGIPVYIEPNGAFYQQVADANKDLIKRVSVKTPMELGDKVVLINHADPSLLSPLKSKQVNIVKNIGMTIFETDRICQEWVDNCNRMDEIWIPTQFNYDVFKDSGVDEYKLKIVRYPYNSELFSDSIDYGTTELGDLGFKFLYVSGYDYRKGYELLIDSFCKAFTKDDDVSLILKLYIPYWSATESPLRTLLNHINKYENRPNICINTNEITTSELITLYNSVDAYISTERASGWGMPEMEMMAMGKPVATIDWGGTTEYINSSNGYPIKTTGEMEDVDQRLQTSRPTYAGHKWASVSPDDVASVLQDIYKDAEKREVISKQAKKDVTTILSPDAIAKEIRSVLGL